MSTSVSAQSKIVKDNSSILIQKGVDLLYNQGNNTEAIKYFDNILALHFNNW